MFIVINNDGWMGRTHITNWNSSVYIEVVLISDTHRFYANDFIFIQYLSCIDRLCCYCIHHQWYVTCPKVALLAFECWRKVYVRTFPIGIFYPPSILEKRNASLSFLIVKKHSWIVNFRSYRLMLTKNNENLSDHGICFLQDACRFDRGNIYIYIIHLYFLLW